MHREDVALGEQRVERGRTTHPKRGEPFVGDVGIEGRHGHAEGVGPHGDFTADATEPDDAERFPLEFATHELGAIPHAVLHGQRRGRQLPQQPDHRAEEQLGDGDRVTGRRVDDRHAEFGGDIEGDVVDTDARPSDDAQLLRGTQQLGGDAGRAAADDGVVVADATKELVLRQSGDFIDQQLRLGGEQGQAFRIDIVGDENAIRHVCTRKRPRGVRYPEQASTHAEKPERNWIQRGRCTVPCRPAGSRRDQ